MENRWLLVYTKPPPVEQRVLVLCHMRGVGRLTPPMIARRRGILGQWVTDEDLYLYHMPVYWMPLPDVPKTAYKDLLDYKQRQGV